MAQALVLDSRTLALCLYDVLFDLDPVRYRASWEASIRQRIARMNAAIEDLRARMPATDMAGYEERLTQLKESMERLEKVLQEYVPHEYAPREEIRRQWKEARKRLTPIYDDMANSLRQLQVQMPTLRPTNWLRTGFHAGAAIASLLLIELALGPRSMVAVAGSFAFMAWFLEITRRYSRLSDRFSWFLFGKMAHPHERRRINSATWYTTALLALSLTGSPMVCSLALGILGIADPVAAIVGRRWGKHRLVTNRTLEGSLGFIGAGLLAAFAILGGWYHDLGFWTLLSLALGAVLPAALAELFARKIDDNLIIPLAAAAGAGSVAMWLGVL